MSTAIALETVQGLLLGKAGATEKDIYMGRGVAPVSCTYKVAGKMFAVLTFRSPGVILKCEADRATELRERYEGIGHRSHLDARFWISVSLDSDVPPKLLKQLIDESYALVCAKLTRAQKAALAKLST